MKAEKLKLWAVRDRDEVKIYVSREEPQLYFSDIEALDKSGQPLEPFTIVCSKGKEFFKNLPDQEAVEITVKQVERRQK